MENKEINEKLKELVLGYKYKIDGLIKENVHVKLAEDWFKNMIHSTSLNEVLKVGFIQQTIDKIESFSKNNPFENEFEKNQKHGNHTEKLKHFDILKIKIKTKIAEIEKNMAYLSSDINALPPVLSNMVQKLTDALNKDIEQLKVLEQKIQRQEIKKPNLFNKIAEKFKKIIFPTSMTATSKGNSLPLLKHQHGKNALLNQTLNEGKTAKTERQQHPNYNTK